MFIKKIAYLSLLFVLIACEPIGKKIDAEPRISFNNLVIKNLVKSDIYNFHVGHLEKDSTIIVFIAPSKDDKIEVYLTIENKSDITEPYQFEYLNHGTFKIGKSEKYNGIFYDSITKNTLNMINFKFQ
jgi:hypothetical protein